MPKNITQYDLLISCPGDITEEIKIINEAVQKFNDLYSDTLGISVRTKHWSKNSYPQSGGKAQALLNEQFVKDCDLAVALFWTRFGSPTDEYGSGTEEEIEVMLNAGKQVFLYFSEKPLSPSQLDQDGFKKIQAFKDKYRDRGIYYTYVSPKDFESKFFAHLTQYFILKKESDDKQQARNPQLVLRGIGPNRGLSENCVVAGFKLNNLTNSSKLLAKIRVNFSEIDSMHMSSRDLLKKDEESDQYPLRSLVNNRFEITLPPIEIEQNIRDVIKEAAKVNKIDISDDFFYLGNLSKIFSFEKVYSGTPDEEHKYELIKELHELILEFNMLSKIEKVYTGLPCVLLALENNGTAIDEDIEVILYFNKGVLQPLEQLPDIQDVEAIRFLLDKCDIKNLFAIPSTYQYKVYEESCKREVYEITRSGSSISFIPFTKGVDLKAKLHKEIANIYCNYEIFEENDQCVLKVKFDYIKHHTVIAFPTPIFIQNIPDKINYVIISQNSPDVMSGTIFVGIK